jgi:hypothetical protein
MALGGKHFLELRAYTPLQGPGATPLSSSAEALAKGPKGPGATISADPGFSLKVEKQQQQRRDLHLSQ